MLVLETLDDADDGPMRVPHRHGPDVHRNPVALFVMQIALGLAGVRGLDRSPDGTFRTASFAPALITMQKGSSGARPAYDFVAQESGDSFRAVAPENNFFLRMKVDDADSDLQALQNAATDLRILELRHGWVAGRHSTVFIGTIHSGFRKET